MRWKLPTQNENGLFDIEAATSDNWISLAEINWLSENKIGLRNMPKAQAVEFYLRFSGN